MGSPAGHDGRIVSFTEKPEQPEGDLANAGIYVNGDAPGLSRDRPRRAHSTRAVTCCRALWVGCAVGSGADTTWTLERPRLWLARRDATTVIPRLRASSATKKAFRAAPSSLCTRPTRDCMADFDLSIGGAAAARRVPRPASSLKTRAPPGDHLVRLAVTCPKAVPISRSWRWAAQHRGVRTAQVSSSRA